jgi:ABC-type phosphate/phosphonate transport system substrate-binding protein
MAEEVATKSLSTRNVTLVSYQLDEVQSSEDKQAQILTDIITRLGVRTKPFFFSSYAQINEALDENAITEGQFVLFRQDLTLLSVVVAKYRALN